MKRKKRLTRKERRLYEGAGPEVHRALRTLDHYTATIVETPEDQDEVLDVLDQTLSAACDMAMNLGWTRERFTQSAAAVYDLTVRAMAEAAQEEALAEQGYRIARRLTPLGEAVAELEDSAGKRIL